MRTAACGGAPTLRPLADGVFALPVFSGRFCALLCEELTHFAARQPPQTLAPALALTLAPIVALALIIALTPTLTRRAGCPWDGPTR